MTVACELASALRAGDVLLLSGNFRRGQDCVHARLSRRASVKIPGRSAVQPSRSSTNTATGD